MDIHSNGYTKLFVHTLLQIETHFLSSRCSTYGDINRNYLSVDQTVKILGIDITVFLKSYFTSIHRVTNNEKLL
jgi:hypothetical protein